eukprot:CAMPEP_0115716136 /NCGR_PEP_ID=MMETSP0272-20121206/76169_1 /TAXON_ID=71861 /ORGANISM="Scrippsiella trochoidea, Strain CCMP3099" /LENGTH=292 /DNA_ID=CAMNT_0003158443 /DNA_START=11 /DNA_END=889 /DNA_ORIENTATION=-
MDGVPVQVQAEAKLCCALNLDRLCSTVFLNCELARGPKAHLVVNLRRQRSVLKIRPDGEMSMLGWCSAEEARTALKRVARKCLQSGIPVKFKGFKVIAIKWARAYRPTFPVDFLELQRHPDAELRQTGASQPLRILLPCGDIGRRAREASSEGAGPSVGGSFSAAQSGQEGADEQNDEVSRAGAGVLAEVSADGRTRFHGAKSVEELQEALEVVVGILEKYKLPDLGGSLAAPGEMGIAGQLVGPGRPFGARRRGPILSREALELEEPVQAGAVVKAEVASAALVVPMVGRP